VRDLFLCSIFLLSIGSNRLIHCIIDKRFVNVLVLVPTLRANNGDDILVGAAVNRSRSPTRLPLISLGLGAPCESRRMIRPGRERNRRAISFRRFRHVTLIQSTGSIRRAVSSHARNESAQRRRHQKPPTLYRTSTDRQRVCNRNAMVRVLAGQTDRR